MKVYPKVPRYDHPAITEDWFSNDIRLLEKYDGSNFRFVVYDKSYVSAYYTEDIIGDINSVSHGDIIVGTKSNMYTPAQLDKAPDHLQLDDKYTYLRSTIDSTQIMRLHSQYNSPLLFFGENMVRHTISYTENTPPILIFDIYQLSDYDPSSSTSYGYDEKFTSFLDFDTVADICTTLGLELVNEIQGPTSNEYTDITQSDIPQSEFGSNLENNKAEGIVIRDDTTGRRSKLRTDEFAELNTRIWGGSGNIDIPAKQIAYAFTTKNRVRKQLSNTRKNVSIPQLAECVVSDFWVEEWREFATDKFIPRDVYYYALERIKYMLLRPNLFQFSVDTEPIAEMYKPSYDDIPEEPANTEDPIEYIIQPVINPTNINSQLDIIYDQSNKTEYGNWMIEPLADRLEQQIWTEHYQRFYRIQTDVSKRAIKQHLFQYMRSQNITQDNT